MPSAGFALVMRFFFWLFVRKSVFFWSADIDRFFAPVRAFSGVNVQTAFHFFLVGFFPRRDHARLRNPKYYTHRFTFWLVLKETALVSSVLIFYFSSISISIFVPKPNVLMKAIMTVPRSPAMNFGGGDHLEIGYSS